MFLHHILCWIKIIIMNNCDFENHFFNQALNHNKMDPEDIQRNQEEIQRNQEETLTLHKEIFTKELEQIYEKTRTTLITRQELDDIKDFLMAKRYNTPKPAGLSKVFKQKISRNFFLQDFAEKSGSIDSWKNVVCRKVGEDKLVRRVVAKEDIFDIIHDFHGGIICSGTLSTYNEICKVFSGITRELVAIFVRHCGDCQLKRNQQKSSVLVPIVSNCFLERVQIDLIDFQKDPSGEFKWIGHCLDHFTKYHVLFPLKKKEAQEVADNLATKFFNYFGKSLEGFLILYTPI